MVAPSVIGHEDKKEGILLSAVMTPEDKPRRKTRIHILFIGPPGGAKTELLHGAPDLVPGSTGPERAGFDGPESNGNGCQGRRYDSTQDWAYSKRAGKDMSVLMKSINKILQTRIS